MVKRLILLIIMINIINYKSKIVSLLKKTLNLKKVYWSQEYRMEIIGVGNTGQPHAKE